MMTPTTHKYNRYLDKRMSPKTSFSIILITGLIIWSLIYTGFSIGDLMVGPSQIGVFFKQTIPPDWDYLDHATQPMLDMIHMAIVGTFLGSIVPIPIALLCASDIVQTKWIVIPSRFVPNIVRAMPDLLLATVPVAISGIGQIPGVLTPFVLAICIIGRLLYESLETTDPGPMEAMTAVGTNKAKWIAFGVVPQVTSSSMSYVLFAFEINIRASVVLGLVGAGSIGLSYDQMSGLLQYKKTTIVILFTLIAIVIIDYVNSKAGGKLA